MRIAIEGGKITLGSLAVRYDHHSLSHRDLNALLARWERRLRTDDATHLPYSYDGEFYDALEATREGELVHLRVVRLDGRGYLHGVDPLWLYIDEPPIVRYRYPKTSGAFARSDLLRALRDRALGGTDGAP